MDKIPENVNTFLDECANEIGRYETEGFAIQTFGELENVESPIEALFLIAFKYLSHLNTTYIGIDRIYIHNEKPYFRSLDIVAQYKINNYRCDFCVRYIDEYSETDRFAIVECDSQQWHERTEKERRYEKRRDRYLQSEGYKVFRFTGLEINENPINCAKEILSYITNIEINELIINPNFE